EEGKKILYNVPVYGDIRFSLHIFDGFFLTTFFAIQDYDVDLRDDQAEDLIRFGMRMKFCENEEEVAEIRAKCVEKTLRAQPNFELPS
ncbi:hypothetical protein PFISCL1PPCAC_19172, partial [Pristionchus fissidentatus]